jgi:hypothetical protein
MNGSWDGMIRSIIAALVDQFQGIVWDAAIMHPALSAFVVQFVALYSSGIRE